jgi:hypothetical protein
MNRQQRRATARRAAKNAMAELKRREADGGAQPDEAMYSKSAILQEYQNAAAFQKIVTEIYDGCVESLRWADGDAPPQAVEDLESDRKMLKALALEARQWTIECGVAFLEIIDPRPNTLAAENRDAMARAVAALDS